MLQNKKTLKNQNFVNFPVLLIIFYNTYVIFGQICNLVSDMQPEIQRMN